MSYEYSEEGLVEKATEDVLNQLDWDVVTAWHNETFGKDGLLGRENKSQVILEKYLFPAFEKLNPDVPATTYPETSPQPIISARFPENQGLISGGSLAGTFGRFLV